MSTNTTSPSAAPAGEAHLSRVLGPLHLWALAVGLVISGNYFGWSYGMESGGPMGLLIALVPVTLFYVTFMLSYSELATMIPHAGGPSAYARRAMGTFGGYMNGISCLIEFVFAPPPSPWVSAATSRTSRAARSARSRWRSSPTSCSSSSTTWG